MAVERACGVGGIALGDGHGGGHSRGGSAGLGHDGGDGAGNQHEDRRGEHFDGYGKGY